MRKKSSSSKTIFFTFRRNVVFIASSAASGEGIIKLLTGTGNDQNYIIVPVSADRGLCGGFNSSINRGTVSVKSLEKDGKEYSAYACW